MSESHKDKSQKKEEKKVLVKAEKLFNKAKVLFTEYKYEAAMQQITGLKKLLKNTKFKPEYAHTMLYAGYILNTIRKNDEAQIWLEEGIAVLKGTEFEPSRLTADLQVQLGIAFQKLGKFNEALAEFNKAGTLYQ